MAIQYIEVSDLQALLDPQTETFIEVVDPRESDPANRNKRLTLGNLLGMLSGEAGASKMNDLQDVQVSNPQTGEVLKFNGEQWVSAQDEKGETSTQSFYWVVKPDYLIESQSISINNQGKVFFGGSEHSIANQIINIPSLQDTSLSRFDAVVFNKLNENYKLIQGSESGTPQTPSYNEVEELLLTYILVSDSGNTEQDSPDLHKQGIDKYLDKGGVNQVYSGDLKQLLNRIVTNGDGTKFLNNKGNYTTPSGQGDMQQSDYDADNDGIVESADKIAGNPGNSKIYGTDSGGTQVWKDESKFLTSAIPVGTGNIKLDGERVYGDKANVITGDITIDDSVGKVGGTATIWHQDSSKPAISTQSGSGTIDELDGPDYQTGQLNLITIWRRKSGEFYVGFNQLRS